MQKVIHQTSKSDGLVMMGFVMGFIAGSVLTVGMTYYLPLVIKHDVKVSFTIKEHLAGIYLESGGKHIGYLIKREGEHWKDGDHRKAKKV